MSKGLKGIDSFAKRLKDGKVLRLGMRQANLQQVFSKTKMGVHYMDLINDCEKLGDYVVNVVEAHINHKIHL